MAALALPKGSLILITGANGFLASHVVEQALEIGYRVRGTVRDLSKSSWLMERFPSDALELVVVPDMATADAFKSAMDGACLSAEPDPTAPAHFHSRLRWVDPFGFHHVCLTCCTLPW